MTQFESWIQGIDKWNAENSRIKYEIYPLESKCSGTGVYKLTKVTGGKNNTYEVSHHVYVDGKRVLSTSSSVADYRVAYDEYQRRISDGISRE